MLFKLYEKMTRNAAADIAVEAKAGIKKLFEEHPKMRV
jgi:hypothetical protein